MRNVCQGVVRIVVLLLAGGCGSRSAVRPEIHNDDDDGGGEAEGEGSDMNCAEACAQAFAACPSGLDFDMDDCVARCEDGRVFDDCTPKCGADCVCINDCYVGDRLTCGGYCKWIRVNECANLDLATCGQACRIDPSFKSCTMQCAVRDCPCLEACF